jgi:hypothetical protein
VAHGDPTPVQEAVPEANLASSMGAPVSSMMGEADVGDPTSSTEPMVGVPSSLPHMAAATASVGADDNAVEEPEVITGHPILRALGDVFLFEAMGTTHWVLNRVHDVLCRERGDIDNEWRHLMLWVSQLKKQTTFEKEKVEARQKHLDRREILLDKKQVVTKKLNADSQKLLADAKDLYSSAQAQANASIN